ncbi:PQQ-dependent sugar dehydrogenase [Saccharibacillus alkalitolerans]|uniref:PQQ-dependent sugar dehydrogenase n=1 Tax=Saccharibacillus alkalitolerans TaxID=2705290 RepID=A0ABX0F9U6_9BACL|nr:PQQ-dependent sugar dehydrogenase [Saccharibacillus alkalitolerans]NGZ76749.1 PQQ-dependent sugar dehydrogenase [Saccharibacillus alkalitolerans]
MHKNRKKLAILFLALPLAACTGQTGAPAGSVPDNQLPVQTPGTDEEPGEGMQNGGSTDNGTADPADGGTSSENPDTDKNAGETGGASVTAGLTGETETAAAGLDTPWEIQFGGSAIYMTLRGGSIVKLENGQQTEQSIELDPAVLEEGEAGLLGLALAPDFEDSREAYAYHTYGQGDGMRNRVIRIKEDASGSGWSETSVLLDDIPGARVHDGGRIAFGPDGMLYVTTGDAQEDSLARDTGSLAGKILRMTPEGEVPDDNPIEGSLVYSYGHRNSQGIDWTEDGTLYASEHGPSGSPGGHDEMNRIEPGADYGWPDVMGDETGEGLTPPLFHTGEEAIAPSGIAATPDGKVLVANLVGESLMEFDPATNEMTEVLSGVGRIRDVAVREGRIYVITSNTDGRGSPSADDDKLLILR